MPLFYDSDFGSLGEPILHIVTESLHCRRTDECICVKKMKQRGVGSTLTPKRLKKLFKSTTTIVCYSTIIGYSITNRLLRTN